MKKSTLPGISLAANDVKVDIKGFLPLADGMTEVVNARRRTDITPASRAYDSSMYPPTSPKMHELLERQIAPPSSRK